MRIITLNANGIRAASRKGFFDWLAGQGADVVCIQETKAQAHQLDGKAEFYPSGYHCFYRDATVKKGYSGVALYTAREPDEVRTVLGREDFDGEGRYVEARFANLSVVSLYFPSGSSGEVRQQYKFRIMDWFAPVMREWLESGREYIVCGDWNIVRSEKDIKNWKSNQKSSGCLPAERAWLNALVEDTGWLDGFRSLKPAAEEYTWWSNRGRARENDVGWRLDYQLATPGLGPRLQACSIYTGEGFSDHAPFIVDYDYAL